MARSYPQSPSHTSDAERQVWRWVVDALDDDVTVVSNVLLTRGSSDAEADLVLVDPSWGIVVVEVKGGTVGYRGGRWITWHDGVEAEIRNPVEQAKRAASFVRAACEQAGYRAVPVTWAVALPHSRTTSPSPSVLPPERLWDASAGQRMADAYRGALPVLTQGQRPPSAAVVDRLAQLLRGRDVQSLESVLPDVEEAEDRVRAFTESHRDAYGAFMRYPRVLVRGAAGTGKTQLAVEVAAVHAARGERVLLACWHHLLGGWLRRQLDQRLREMRCGDLEASGDLRSTVVAGHLAGLVATTMGDAWSWDPATDDKRTTFQERLPALLTAELTHGAFGVIVLDEAQDFTESWAAAITELVEPATRVYAFAHTEQDLFGEGSLDIAQLCPVEQHLREQFRSTRQIAEVAARLLEPIRVVLGPVEHLGLGKK